MKRLSFSFFIFISTNLSYSFIFNSNIYIFHKYLYMYLKKNVFIFLFGFKTYVLFSCTQVNELFRMNTNKRCLSPFLYAYHSNSRLKYNFSFSINSVCFFKLINLNSISCFAKFLDLIVSTNILNF